MKILISETVPGVGRVEAVVDDENYTIIKYWKPENDGPRPDMLMEMSPRMGDVAEKLMAQYGGALAGAKVPGTEN